MFTRARWFQLFVMDSFGEPSYSAGYREKHFGLYGFGVGGLLYPPQALPMWQNFFQRVQKQVFGFPAAYIWSDACHIHQNLLSYQEKHYGWGEKVVGMAYTPHQCSYSDRKSPYWEKSPKVLFFVPEYGHFCQKCPSLHAQNGISGARLKILRPLL